MLAQLNIREINSTPSKNDCKTNFLVPCRLGGEEETVPTLDYSHRSLEHVLKEIFVFEKTFEELHLGTNH